MISKDLPHELLHMIEGIGALPKSSFFTLRPSRVIPRASRKAVRGRGGGSMTPIHPPLLDMRPSLEKTSFWLFCDSVISRGSQPFFKADLNGGVGFGFQQRGRIFRGHQSPSRSCFTVSNELGGLCHRALPARVLPCRNSLAANAP